MMKIINSSTRYCKWLLQCEKAVLPICSPNWSNLGSGYFFTIRSMPHLGHWPGLLVTTSGCMGQVYWVAMPAGAAVLSAAVAVVVGVVVVVSVVLLLSEQLVAKVRLARARVQVRNLFMGLRIK